jgi:hypothetical protein
MFKLVAVIFAVVNGVPSDQPSKVFPHPEVFESLEACMKFAKADENAEMREALKGFVQSQRGAITAKLGCTKAEDNSI